jgi:hypothetical protein
MPCGARVSTLSREHIFSLYLDYGTNVRVRPTGRIYQVADYNHHNIIQGEVWKGKEQIWGASPPDIVGSSMRISVIMYVVGC